MSCCEQFDSGLCVHLLELDCFTISLFHASISAYDPHSPVLKGGRGGPFGNKISLIFVFFLSKKNVFLDTIVFRRVVMRTKKQQKNRRVSSIMTGI